MRTRQESVSVRSGLKEDVAHVWSHSYSAQRDSHPEDLSAPCCKIFYVFRRGYKSSFYCESSQFSVFLEIAQFFISFLFFLEVGGVQVSEGEREREREKQGSCSPTVGLELTNCEIMT